MKKFLIGIAMFFTVMMLCVVSAGAEIYGDYEYELLDDGTVEITNYTGTATDLEIPSEIEGKNVTSICRYAFSGCSSIVSAVIPKGVTSIGDYAFRNCTALTSIDIPDGVTAIEYSAFLGCSSLVAVNIPNSVTNIDEFAFYGCTSLLSVTIPNSITNIGNCAFYNCYSLTSITFPSSVKSIGGNAFYCCTSLESVTISEGVTSIGKNAFEDCTAISSVTIPASVTTIGESPFAGCRNLEAINVDANNEYYISVNGVLFNKDKTTVISYPANKTDTKYVIPDSVTCIDAGAFYECTSLESISIPDSVISIGDYAFNDCNSLTSVDIPDSVTCIGDSAFRYCSFLTSIIIPDSVTSIGSNTFFGCNRLVINCYKNSVAYEFATENGMSYKLIVTTISNFTLKSRNYNSVTLNWSQNTSADGYILQQLKNGTWTNVANITSNAVTSYQITGLAANTAYKFRAVAYTADGSLTTYSKYTGALAVSTAPAMTTGFAITGRGSDFLTVSWTKNAGASGYVIQEQIDGVWTKVVAIKGNTTTSYKITGLQPNSFHRYRMVAYKTDANGTCYGKYTGSAPGYTAPAMVSGFKVSDTGNGSLTLSWNKVASAGGYVVDIYKNGAWSQLAKITSNATTSYKATGLSVGTTYKFRIKSYAVNNSLTIYSTYSSAISGVSAPSAPANLKMTNRGTDFISVRWDKNTVADGYMVYIYDGTKWTCVKTLTNNSSVSHKITGLASGKAYKITVKAYKTVSGTKHVSDSTTISAATL